MRSAAEAEAEADAEVAAAATDDHRHRGPRAERNTLETACERSVPSHHTHHHHSSHAFIEYKLTLSAGATSLLLLDYLP
jgi:hypothetical protein